MDDTHPIYFAGTHRQRYESVNDVAVALATYAPAVDWAPLCGDPLEIVAYGPEAVRALRKGASRLGIGERQRLIRAVQSDQSVRS